jgi:UDP-glucuronate 4-epimerase
MLKNERVLLTGAAGFIGSHLALKLLKMENQVLGIDNLDSYYDPRLKNARLSKLSVFKKFKFLELDLENFELTNKSMSEYKPTIVIHLAAQAGIRLEPEQFHKYIKSNLTAFGNIATATLRSSVPRFLYASSSSVYGNSTQEVFSEFDKELIPVSFYGATKLANEIIAKTTFINSETKSRGLRFFTVYGESGRPDMSYFKILDSLVNSINFPIYGDGNVLRDFTYISDVTQAITLLAGELDFHNPGFSDVVNIGGGDPRSLNEMIVILEKLTGMKLERNFQNSILADVKKTVASTEYIQRLIDFKPQVSLENGLSRFVDWGLVQFRDQKNDKK